MGGDLFALLLAMLKRSQNLAQLLLVVFIRF
jgi:hypothetical protein